MRSRFLNSVPFCALKEVQDRFPILFLTGFGVTSQVCSLLSTFLGLDFVVFTDDEVDELLLQRFGMLVSWVRPFFALFSGLLDGLQHELWVWTGWTLRRHLGSYLWRDSIELLADTLSDDVVGASLVEELLVFLHVEI